MMPALLFGSFVGVLLMGAPIFVALSIAALMTIGAADLGLSAISHNVYAGIAKYPLLAAPMFILTGAIFERSGVAQRLLALAAAIFGNGPGALAVTAVAVAMLMGGISGSAAAIAGTVAGIMTSSMIRAGYPRGFIATVIGAAAATDILIPPSISLIVFSVLVPQASVPAMFAAGIVPGTLAAVALMVPVYLISRHYGFGKDSDEPRPPFWKSLREAFWGLFAKVLILGGLRFGFFTPTEAGVIAVFYALFVGFFVYKTLNLRDLYEMLCDAAELTAVIMMIVAYASVFGWATNTIGIVDPLVQGVINLGWNQYAVLALLIAFLIVVGMFLEGMSTFLILVPVLMPIAHLYHWDPVWFGVILTLKIAIGQFTPPLAVNLMVTCKVAGIPIEATLRWVWWLMLTMFLTLIAVVAFPDLALWLPRVLEIH